MPGHIPRSARWLGLVAAALLAVSSGARAGIVWNESSNGDLAGNRLTPSSVTLALGENDVVGSTVFGDLDYLTINVPADTRLDAMFLDRFVSTDDIAFVAIQQGSTFTQPAGSPDVAQLLGWTHFSASEVGTDILDDVAAGTGAIGFAAPLASGAYTFWIQQASPQTVGYTFDFRVSAVPIPELSPSVLLGALAFGVLRARGLRLVKAG